jgi:hypothetical protein
MMIQRRYELSDEQWEQIKGFRPIKQDVRQN